MPIITGLQPPDDVFVASGAALTVSIAATDREGDAIQYQILLDGAPLAAWGATSSVSWTPTLAQLGMHTLKFSVRDDFGGSRTDENDIYVARPPIAHP
jgi:hypothetical protein